MDVLECTTYYSYTMYYYLIGLWVVQELHEVLLLHPAALPWRPRPRPSPECLPGLEVSLLLLLVVVSLHLLAALPLVQLGVESVVVLLLLLGEVPGGVKGLRARTRGGPGSGQFRQRTGVGKTH